MLPGLGNVIGTGSNTTNTTNTPNTTTNSTGGSPLGSNVTNRTRPINGTNATNTSSNGGGYGDPHLKTWRGHVFDFHGECDLILAKSANFANGLGFELHIRTEMRRDWSFISEASLKIGNDVFEVGKRGLYRFNGKTGARLVGSIATLPQTISGYPIHHVHYDDKRHKFEVELGESGVVAIKIYNEFLSVTIDHGHDYAFHDSIGLTGDFTTGELLGRVGRVIQDTNDVGQEWQVLDTEPKLFREQRLPQYPQKCNMPAPGATARRRLAEGMISFSDAENACKDWDAEGREACIYDVMATGDLGMAQAGSF